jgi:hypothetical protein
MGKAGGLGERGKNVVALEVGIIGENFSDAHTTGQPFKDRFDRIPQSPDARLAVTNCRVAGDTVAHRGDSRGIRH